MKTEAPHLSPTGPGATLQERLATVWGVDPANWMPTDAADRRCIGFVNRRGGVDWWDATKLLQESSARAAWLREAGLGPSQVAVLVTSDPRFATVCLLAILQLGAVPLLVAPPAIKGVRSNLARVLPHVIALSSAHVVLLPRSMAADAETIAAHGVTVLVGDEGHAHAGDTVPVVLPQPDQIVALQLTSGTTGLPRICTWQHPQLLAAIDGMCQAMALRTDDRFVNWTPLYHDMGLVNNTLLCLARGLELVVMDPFHFVGDPSLWLRTMHAVDATQTWSPNFGYALAAQRIQDTDIEGVQLEGMRGFWNAGEKVHHRTFVAFYERFRGHGVRWPALKANFGCAENIGGATFTDPHGELVVEHVDPDALHRRRAAEPVDPTTATQFETVVSTGCGHPSLAVHILGDDGAVLEDGRVGRIALASPSRMVGFLGQPEATREVLGDDHVLTGDLGYLREGELFWVGRDREQINLSGVKYDPSDFEAALDRVAALRKGCFAAFGVVDEQHGTQRLVVISEVRSAPEGDGLALCEAIRTEIATSLGVSVSEVALARRGQLEKTSSGKRRHLSLGHAYVAGTLELLVRHRFSARG
jgi:fatty-acyl-CoA synthase